MPQIRQKDSLRVYSWNVNGIRAATKKGLDDWILKSNAEIIGLQEVRAEHSAIPEEIAKIDHYHQHFVAAERKGYSGVGLLSRRALCLVTSQFLLEPGHSRSLRASSPNDFGAQRFALLVAPRFSRIGAPPSPWIRSSAQAAPPESVRRIGLTSGWPSSKCRAKS